MKKILFTIVSASLMLACSSSKSSLSDSESTISENSKLSAVLWQQTSAEYDALCYQAFNIAASRLNNTAMDQMAASPKKAAIVMDLDETVLDNSPYNGWLIEKNKAYSQESWTEWSNLSEADFVPGALEFIELAQMKGFKILFISNRSIEELEPTVINLQKGGIEVNSADLLLRESSSSKVERREMVLQNYDIYMLIGDNLADFNNQFDKDLGIDERKALMDKFNSKFGERFIILPNVMYGDWEKALKSNKSSNSIQNYNAEGLKKYLKTY